MLYRAATEEDMANEWSDHSGKVHGYDRDVLIIVSEDVSGPAVVQRRAAIELAEWKTKLEKQGIAREDMTDDLSIVRARHHLDKDCTVTGVEMSSPEGERLTKERVLKQITTTMSNYNNRAGGKFSY